MGPLSPTRGTIAGPRTSTRARMPRPRGTATAVATTEKGGSRMSGSSFRRLPCVIAVAMLTLVLGAAPASATPGPWGGQLSFHPSLPAAPPPTVTASPATNLLDRQLTRVRATGFKPGSNVVVQECKVKVPPTSDPAFCDRGTSQFTRADFTGAVDASIPVHRVVRVANGRADCVTTPNGCEARVMATAYYGDPVPGGESGAAS